MNPSSKLFKELTTEEITRLVAFHFHAEAVLDAHLLGGGLFNTTYQVTLHSPDKRLVLRAGPVNRHVMYRFEQNLMQAEQYVYQLYADCKIPCSQVLVCDTSKTLIDRDYMFVEYLDSLPLTDESIPQADKSAVYQAVGAYTAKMHAITNPAFGRVSCMLRGETYPTWGAFIQSEVSETIDLCARHNLFSPETLHAFAQVFDRSSCLYDSVTMPHLLHTDLWDGNILVKRSSGNEKFELAAIIDADRALFGDIDYEFATPWIMGDAFMQGYGEYGVRNADQVLKMDTYRLLSSFMGAYIWHVEYNNMAAFEASKDEGLVLLKSLVNQ